MHSIKIAVKKVRGLTFCFLNTPILSGLSRLKFCLSLAIISGSFVFLFMGSSQIEILQILYLRIIIWLNYWLKQFTVHQANLRLPLASTSPRFQYNFLSIPFSGTWPYLSRVGLALIPILFHSLLRSLALSSRVGLGNNISIFSIPYLRNLTLFTRVGLGNKIRVTLKKICLRLAIIFKFWQFCFLICGK